VTGAAKDAGELHADCARCAALCCVAPGFSVSADFAINKAPGQPCPNLGPDFRCGIHERLRPDGFTGCAVFDCFGAGQQVTQVTFQGRDWRHDPEIAPAMFASFAVMRPLHELRWHVAQALALTAELSPGVAEPVTAELAAADRTLRQLAGSSPDELAVLDLDAVRGPVTAALRQASQALRGETPAGLDLGGADLIGRDLAGKDLRRASLRGAYLIGADLTRADLRRADLTGADLRGAELAGANLSSILFLTQAQLDAARGDATTELAPGLRHPAHWASQRSPASPRPRPSRARPPGGDR
jgi:uncharacterized protein YjbI with pentapeptide repeats